MHQQVSFKTLIYVWSDILKSAININYDSSNLEEFDCGKKQNILCTEQIIVRYQLHPRSDIETSVLNKLNKHEIFYIIVSVLLFLFGSIL